MPTSRPSAGTFAANLNASHPIVANALGLWVVDANADVPDLIGVQPDAIQDSLNYATTGVLGGHFTGLGVTSGRASTSHPLAAAVGSFPLILGVVFTYTGTKSASSGHECLFSLGDSTINANVFHGIFLDDGSVASPGDIVGRFRPVGGGSIPLGNVGQYVSGQVNAVVFVIYDSSGMQIAGFLNGAKIFDAAAFPDPGAFDATCDWAAGLALNRFGNIANECTTSTDVAAWWYSQTKLTDQDYIDWTADWCSITAPAAVPQFAYPISDDDVGAWQSSEATRKNTLTHTEDFLTDWIPSGTTRTQGATTPPSVASNAIKLTETATFGAHQINCFPLISIDAGSVATCSCYVKQAERSVLRLDMSGAGFADFDASDGTIHNDTSDTGTSMVADSVSGWWRCTMRNTVSVTQPVELSILIMPDTSGGVAYNGDGSSGIYIAAADERQGSPGAYQPILTSTFVPDTRLFPVVADGGTGTPDDTTYAFVLVPGSPWWFKLGPTTMPALLTGTAGSIRALSPQSRSVQFDLYQGYLGTLIGTRTYNLTAGIAQFDPSFTDPELTNVTDLNDIHGVLTGIA